MKFTNFNELYAYKYKKGGLIFASIFIVIEIIGQISGMHDSQSTGMNVYVIMACLFTAMFSREDGEDERTKIVRYFALKQTFTILVMVIATTSAFHFSFSYYSIIVSMLCYFPIFELANYYNPDFIFKERTSKMQGGCFIKACLIYMTIIAVFDLIMHFVK